MAAAAADGNLLLQLAYNTIAELKEDIRQLSDELQKRTLDVAIGQSRQISTLSAALRTRLCGIPTPVGGLPPARRLTIGHPGLKWWSVGSLVSADSAACSPDDTASVQIIQPLTDSVALVAAIGLVGTSQDPQGGSA
ncbi:hypothetical protein Q8A73_017108 [Channa argus]|nr:hypothetical protein Q8A73_017108 [Channa argus]